MRLLPRWGAGQTAEDAPPSCDPSLAGSPCHDPVVNCHDPALVPWPGVYALRPTGDWQLVDGVEVAHLALDPTLPVKPDGDGGWVYA